MVFPRFCTVNCFVQGLLTETIPTTPKSPVMIKSTPILNMICNTFFESWVNLAIQNLENQTLPPPLQLLFSPERKHMLEG